MKYQSLIVQKVETFSKNQKKQRLGRAAMTQRWERSPTTNVAWVQILDLASQVGWWVCWWFSTLLQGLFLLVSSLYYQNPIRSVSNTPRAVSLLLGNPWGKNAKQVSVRAWVRAAKLRATISATWARGFADNDPELTTIANLCSVFQCVLPYAFSSKRETF